MKTMFESSEAFTAYATIDAAMYMIREIQKEMNKPMAPINAAIDKATGYDKVRHLKHYEALIPIFEDMIDAKKFIGMEYESTEKLLAVTRKLIEQAKTQQKQKQG